MAAGFSKYFSDLATPTHRPEYDMLHNGLVDRDVTILDELADMCYARGPNILDVSNTEVALCLRKLKTGKAADYFGLTTEHILHARVLIPLLARMFTFIFQNGIIPMVFREDFLIPFTEKA